MKMPLIKQYFNTSINNDILTSIITAATKHDLHKFTNESTDAKRKKTDIVIS